MTNLISRYLPKEMPKVFQYAIKAAGNIYQNISTALFYSLSLFYSSIGSVAGILKGRVKDLTPQKSVPEQSPVVAAPLEILATTSIELPKIEEAIQAEELVKNEELPKTEELLKPEELLKNEEPPKTEIALPKAEELLKSEELLKNEEPPKTEIALPRAEELLKSEELPKIKEFTASIPVEQTVPPEEIKVQEEVTIEVDNVALKSNLEQLSGHMIDIAQTARAKAQNTWEASIEEMKATANKLANDAQNLTMDQAIQKMAKVARDILQGDNMRDGVDQRLLDPFHTAVSKPE